MHVDEERRMYNAMVSPPVNPHPFFSDEFEQAGVTHLSSAGGTPIFYYLEPTTHPAEGDDGGVPTPILSGAAGSPVGAAMRHPPIVVEDTVVPLLADEGGGGSDDAEDLAASDRPSHPTAGGMLPSPLLPLRW
jgi:hypothetical protein